MFLLHTKIFQPQTDGLNKSDFAAIWSLLISFESPQMVLYNCGADAGASQGHKHLQIFPASKPENCVMFPENLHLYYGRPLPHLPITMGANFRIQTKYNLIAQSLFRTL